MPTIFSEVSSAHVLQGPVHALPWVLAASAATANSGAHSPSNNKSGPDPFSRRSFTTLFAAACGGAVSRTCVSPFERLKILFQTQRIEPGQPPKYHGVTQSLKLIFKEEGFKGYFRGNGANVVRIAPTAGLQFYTYEQLKRFYPNDGADISGWKRAQLGGLAGATALVATYPLEFVRGRLTVQTHDYYRGLIHGFQRIAKEEGVRAYYKGMWPSLLGVIPFIGIEFAVYDTLKKQVLSKLNLEPGQTPGPQWTLSCGAIAAACAQTVAYPLDLIRRRLGIQDFSHARSHYRYNGVADAFVTIYKKEGFFGMYKGLIPNFLKVVPAVGITFMVVEEVKVIMGVTKR